MKKKFNLIFLFENVNFPFGKLTCLRIFCVCVRGLFQMSWNQTIEKTIAEKKIIIVFIKINKRNQGKNQNQNSYFFFLVDERNREKKSCKNSK